MLILILTALTLVAFAANSLLCRMALGGNFIDPVSFTTIRLVSGAVILIPTARIAAGSRRLSRHQGSWGSALALFLYAAAFSLAYVSLDTGMGALILFGAVQATMIGTGLKSGERPLPRQWLGLTLALAGLTYLVWPGITAPDPLGAVFMLTAGISWGIYSLRGKKVVAPVASTAGNFLRAAPLALVASGLSLALVQVEGTGVLLALISGMLTSGLGYVVWYRVLPGLTTTGAAIVQLLVPVLAAFGGVVFLAEEITLRLILASISILGGVAMAVFVTRSKAHSKYP